MKVFFKTGVLIIAAAIILAMSACDKSDPDTSTSGSTSSSLNETSEINSDATAEVEIPFTLTELESSDEESSLVAYLQEKFGKTDAQTGFDMIYNVGGTIEYNGEPYYFVWVRWLVQDENGNPSHSSRLGEMLVSMDKTKIYNAFSSGNMVTVYTKDVSSETYDAPVGSENSSMSEFLPESVPIESTSVEIPYDVVEVSDEYEKNDIIEFVKQTRGEIDSETGFLMTYGVEGMVNYNDAPYYLVTIRWLVQDESGNATHSSRLGELLVSKYKTEVYNAYVAGNTITVYR